MLSDKNCSSAGKIQYGQVLCYEISSLGFVLTRLENIHFSNLRDNFRINVIWH